MVRYFRDASRKIEPVVMASTDRDPLLDRAARPSG
jgi:hypothetical protein